MTQAKTLADSAREHRSHSAVLKTRLSKLRTRFPDKPILIFEGDADVGPYKVWLTHVRPALSYEPLPGAGKGQVLNLRASLQFDTTGLRRSVYFVVDHDFDGLRGQDAGPDIFCTIGYSMENWLATNMVVENVLTDELRCTAEDQDRETLMALFREAMRQFVDCMHDVNLRLYRSSRLKIQGRGTDDDLRKYVAIELGRVAKSYLDNDLLKLVQLESEVEAGSCEAIDADFARLDARKDHRGKFLLSFLMKWILAAVAERNREGQTTFVTQKRVHFSVERLTLVSLAARSEAPAGLQAFSSGIA